MATQNTYCKYLQEVEQVLQAHKVKDPFVDAGFSQFQRLGIDVPTQRKISKQGYSFSTLDHNALRNIWDYIWHHSEYYEAMSQALLYFDGLKNNGKLVDCWPTLEGFAHRLDNWAHSDLLSSLYVEIVALQPDLILSTLEQWNKSPNPWLRRQSVVSLIYYVSKRRKVLPFTRIKAFVVPLLNDKHYYVQKGVGWTIREMYKTYPDKTRAFIGDQLHQLSPIAFTTAIEKVPIEVKNQWKEQRKKQRQSQ